MQSIISVETTLLHPRRGFIKLEDAAVVTNAGFEIHGIAAAAGIRGSAVSA